MLEFYLRVFNIQLVTSERSEQVRCQVEHEKIKFISTGGRVIFCLLPLQGFGPEAKTRGGIIVSPPYTYKECVNIGVVCTRSMRINPDLMKLGAHGGPG